MTLLSAIRAALGGACGPRPTYRDGSAWRMSDAAVAKARAEDPLRTACASHRAEREHLEAANRGLLEVNANLEDQNERLLDEATRSRAALAAMTAERDAAVAALPMTHPGYPRHYHGGAGYVPRIPATACGQLAPEHQVTRDEGAVGCAACLRLIARWRSELAAKQTEVP